MTICDECTHTDFLRAATVQATAARRELRVRREDAFRSLRYLTGDSALRIGADYLLARAQGAAAVMYRPKLSQEQL